MKSTSEFVVPRERTVAEKVFEVVLDELGSQGRWLAIILAESGVVASDSEESWLALRELLLQWKRFGDEQEWRDAPLLAAILSKLRDLTGSHHLSCEGIELALDRLRKYVVDRGIDLRLALRETNTRDWTRERLTEYAGRLVLAELADPAEFLDFSRLIERGRLSLRPFVPVSHGSPDDVTKEMKDLGSPVLWMVAAPVQTSAAVIARMSACDSTEAAAIALGFLNAYSGVGACAELLMTIREGARGTVLLRIFEELDGRVGEDPRKAVDALREVWLRYWLAINWRSPKVLGQRLDERVRGVAEQELGKLRGMLGRAHEEGAAEQFDSRLLFIANCAEVLFATGTLWDAVRPLLLAFRSLSKPALADDLRYWEEQDRERYPDPPMHWSAVPDMLVHLFHGHAGDEESEDDVLLDLRTRFARFCLERLKSKRKGGEPVEPSGTWRWAYVRAVRELRVNPEGEGHHVLYYASAHDPDPEVREAAKEAYQELRHGPSLRKDSSPRRAFLSAWWWICQAHLISFGRKVDENGAQRTHEREVRRTTKPGI